ncbi:MAG TPA: response regulator [Kiritimatiellia bacterium]|nr:response regulator [Kiritimatiellia bacterium]
MKILVADDDAMVARCFSECIRQLGHVCDVVHDGNTCFVRLDESPYDVLFADLIMPGKSIFELLEGIRRKGLGTRVVAVSAQDDPMDIQEILRRGATAYLIKPVAVDVLEHTLGRLAGLPQAG